MSTNREKTSSVMGITVSVLLHGIFFAGCLALDASSVSGGDTVQETPTELPATGRLAGHPDVKS